MDSREAIITEVIGRARRGDVKAVVALRVMLRRCSRAMNEDDVISLSEAALQIRMRRHVIAEDL